MADMIAGAAWHEIGGVAQGYLAQLKEQLEIVYVPDIKTTPASGDALTQILSLWNPTRAHRPGTPSPGGNLMIQVFN
jgi:hypothetical protein